MSQPISFITVLFLCLFDMFAYITLNHSIAHAIPESNLDVNESFFGVWNCMHCILLYGSFCVVMYCVVMCNIMPYRISRYVTLHHIISFTIIIYNSNNHCFR